MALKGLKNFKFVTLTKDTKEELTYDTTIHDMVGARNVKVKPKSDTAKLFGDDQLLETATSLGEIEVEIEITGLSLEQKAIILGHTYKDGILVENNTDQAPDLAFGFIATKSNGKERMVWLTKGKAEPLEEEGKTKEDKIDFQTQKIKYIFMPRINDGNYKVTADTDVENAPTVEEFFTVDFLTTMKKPAA